MSSLSTHENVVLISLSSSLFFICFPTDPTKFISQYIPPIRGQKYFHRARSSHITIMVSLNNCLSYMGSANCWAAPCEMASMLQIAVRMVDGSDGVLFINGL